MDKLIKEYPKTVFNYTNIKVDKIKEELDECVASSFLLMHIEMYKKIIYSLLKEKWPTSEQ